MVTIIEHDIDTKVMNTFNQSVAQVLLIFYGLYMEAEYTPLSSYPSKVNEAPTLWAAWLRFWVSRDAPRPRVAPVASLTLYARAAIPRSLILACGLLVVFISMTGISYLCE